MDTFTWGQITQLEDGHRLFYSVDNRTVEEGGAVRIAITDDSGRTPDSSDDGVLWLDFDWNLIISSPDGVMCIPVKRESDGEQFSTVSDISTLLYLSAEFDWPIEDQTTTDNTLYSVTREGK